MKIGLDEKFPQDYRLAQQVCLAIANISDRRKVGDMGGCGSAEVSGEPPVAFPTLAFCFLLLSLPWVNATHPSGCLRIIGCLNDFRRWSQRVSSPKGPKVGLAGPFQCSDQLLSLGFAQPDPLWIPFKEVAVTLTYQLAEGPDVICAQMLQSCAKQALERLEKNITEADPSE